MKLRLLADDLTGALDSAAAFAGEVPVFLDAPPADDDAPIGVVATATRDVPPADLPLLLALSLPWLRAADVAFKKVDSLLRGNTFAECAYVAREGGFARVVFAPAYPAQGRRVIEGRAWREQPGSAVRQPILDGVLAQGFARLPVGDVWVPDVRDDADLDAVAAHSLRAGARGWLWCGSAGLAHALARVHDLRPRVEPMARGPGAVLLVSASHHDVVRRQWERLRASLVSPTALAMHDLSPRERLSPTRAAALLEQQAVALAASPPPGMLVVVGGDTLRALCKASGATAMRARASPRTGWGVAVLVGGRWNGVPVATRSGAFGDDDDLLDAVQAFLPTA